MKRDPKHLSTVAALAMALGFAATLSWITSRHIDPCYLEELRYSIVRRIPSLPQRNSPTLLPEYSYLAAAEVEPSNQQQPTLLTYGAPEGSVLYRGSYCMAHDGRTRSARWVLEYMTKESLTGHADRAGLRFKEDTAIPIEFRALPRDYVEPVYDIGHLAASANYTTESLQAATFVLSNAVPQVADFNRGRWAELEAKVRNITRESRCLWCVTAPIYATKDSNSVTYKLIGKEQVAVPTHCGKAVLRQRIDGSIELRAWVLPNASGSKELPMYEVTTDEFERQSGLNVWSSLDEVMQSRLESVR